MREDTFGYLYVHAYPVTIYCIPCDRSSAVDLFNIDPRQSFINRRWICSKCGTAGRPIIGAPYTGMSKPFENPEVIAETERRKAALKERYGITDAAPSPSSPKSP